MCLPRDCDYQKNNKIADKTATQEGTPEAAKLTATKEELFKNVAVYDPTATTQIKKKEEPAAVTKEQEEPTATKAKPMTKEELFRNTPVYNPRATKKEEEKEPPLSENNNTPDTATKEKELKVIKEEDNGTKHPLTQSYQYRPSPSRGRKQSMKAIILN